MEDAGLLSAFKALAENTVNYRHQMCKVYQFLTQHPDDADELSVVIDNPNIPASSVARVICENGFEISADTIKRHRKRLEHKGCKCPVKEAK